MDIIISWALIFLLIFIIRHKRKDKKDNEAIERYKYNAQYKKFEDDSSIPSPHYQDSQETTQQANIKHAYESKPLLSANEHYAYKKLKSQADQRDLIICPKVRLADIVQPHRSDPNYMSYFGRIKSKHVDFVVCNQRMHVLGVIELDDKSHDTQKRQERDQLVDEILTSVGYKVIHTRDITADLLDRFL